MPGILICAEASLGSSIEAPANNPMIEAERKNDIPIPRIAISCPEPSTAPRATNYFASRIGLWQSSDCPKGIVNKAAARRPVQYNGSRFEHRNAHDAAPTWVRVNRLCTIAESSA